MSNKIIGCISKARTILQRRSFSLYAIPRAVPPQNFLPRVAVSQTCTVGPSRLFSSAGNLFKRAKNADELDDGSGHPWMTRGVPDVKKWNALMDDLAVQSKTDESVIPEWANLLEEGVAAGLPEIEVTLVRHREISPNLDEYMDRVLAEDDEFDEEFDEELDEEFDENDDDEDEDELSDEELAELIKKGEKGEGALDKGEGEGRVLEDVARDELANELEREQGDQRKGNKKGRKY